MSEPGEDVTLEEIRQDAREMVRWAQEMSDARGHKATAQTMDMVIDR